MPWYPAQIRTRMQTFLALASTQFYRGGDPNFDGTRLVLQFPINTNDFTVNANLAPCGGGYGVEVSELFTELVGDQTAQIFVLGHEYGHGMTQAVMQSAQLNNLTGPCHEIIADLISAYLLGLMGIAPATLIHSLNGVGEHVFNTHANSAQAGHHPTGELRVAYINTLTTLLHDFSFQDSLRAVLLSLGCR